MQKAEIAALVANLRVLPAETTFCEFKQNWNAADDIGKLVSAISNAACLEGERYGYIVWGVEDGTHALVGTDFNFLRHSPGSGNQELQLWLAQMLQPSISFRFESCTIETHRIVIMTIPAANAVSTKYKHIAYIRIGNTTPKLSDYPEREAALTVALRPYVWEKGVAAHGLTSEQVFDLLHVDSYFDLLGLTRPGSEGDTLDRLGADHIIDREHRGARYLITNYGAVLFGRRLEAFEPTSRKVPRVVRYSGKSRTETIKEQPGLRGYAAGFHGLIRYIMSELPQVERIIEGFRRSISPYHEDMIREAVANALIHQDMSVAGAGPLIEIFKDRVEITNPGRPVIEPSRFIDMPPRSRNELMAKMMRRMNICEERGTGVDKIISAAEDATLPAPDFRMDGDNTRVILYGPRPFRETNSSERVRAAYHHSVLRFIKSDRMTNATLRVRLGIDERNAAQVSRILAQAQEERLIKQSDSWSARSGTYVPIWA